MHGSNHLSSAEIAILVDGNPQGAVTDERRDHLATCPECYAAYAEAVTERLGHPSSEKAESVPADWITAATALATAGRKAQRDRRPTRLGLRPAFIGCAAVAAMILIVVWHWPDSPSGPIPNLDPGHQAQLVAALMASSQEGMILPGGEGAANVERPVYRGDEIPAGAALSAAIDDATNAYLATESSADLAVQVIGAEIAIGQIGNARVMLEHARRRFTTDDRLIVLEAVIAYRQSELVRAEELLRQVVPDDGGCAAALFNLGFLLGELGRTEEARPYLERARRARPSTQLAARAARMLPDNH